MGSTVRILGQDWLEIILADSVIVDGVPFDIVVAANNSAGESDTAYDGCELCLQINDQDGNALTYTMDEGGGVMASGEATYSNVRVTVGTAAQVNITVTTAETTATIKGAGFEAHDYCPEGVDLCGATAPVLVITAAPAATTRDTNFALTIQAQDGNGNVLTGATNTITITLSSADAADKFTSPTPDATTYTATLTAGEYTIATQQITGGTGSDAATITVTADGCTEDSHELSIVVLNSSSSYSSKYRFVGVGSVSSSETDPDIAAHWATAQADGHTAFDGDSSQDSANAEYLRVVTHESNYGWCVSASLAGGAVTFDLTGKKAGVSAAILRALVSTYTRLNISPWTSAFYSGGSLKVVYSESNAYSTGSAIHNATANHTFTASEIVALQQANGGTASNQVRIPLDISSSLVDYIAGMSGNTLYMWFLWDIGNYLSCPGLNYKIDQRANMINTGGSYNTYLDLYV